MPKRIKPNTPEDHAIISNWIIVFFVAAILVFGLLIHDTLAQPNQQYMVIRFGALGYNFDCVNDYPYDLGQQMEWNNNVGFAELKETPRLIEQIIEVQNCNLDNIYMDQSTEELFRFGFAERVTDEHPNHRHVTRGAWWVYPKISET